MNFASYLRSHYRGATPDQFVPTETPGYWERKELCGGRDGGCRQEIHTFLLNEGPMRHTVSFFDEGRDERGRFLSPYRTWRDAVGPAQGGEHE